MKFRSWLGVLLILIGGGLLAQNMGYIRGTAGDAVGGIALAAGAVLFLSLFGNNRQQWWWLIPGFALIGVSLIVFSDLFFNFPSGIEDLLVLGFIGLGFIMIYITNREQWWAIIPGGVMVTLGLTSLLESAKFLSGFNTEGLFFLGLGLTFLIVWLIPTQFGRLKWAIYPAVVLLLFGLFISGGANEEIFNYVWPILLIGAGGYFLLRDRKKE